MLDGEQTGFIFVLNPERLPIIETSNAIDMLDQYHLHVKTLIVNRVLPENGEGQFFKQRKDQEAMYLEEIKTKDRKSTRLNSSHVAISYAVFCLKKKKKKKKKQEI